MLLWAEAATEPEADMLQFGDGPLVPVEQDSPNCLVPDHNNYCLLPIDFCRRTGAGPLQEICEVAMVDMFPTLLYRRHHQVEHHKPQLVKCSAKLLMSSNSSPKMTN